MTNLLIYLYIIIVPSIEHDDILPSLSNIKLETCDL